MVRRRLRGERTDLECINTVCELVAAGCTLITSRVWVGVNALTWHNWREANHHRILEKYKVAVQCYLEHMADATLEILEKLKRDRDAALKKYNAELREYRRALRDYEVAPKDAKLEKPVEPVYDGPSEFDIRIADMRVRERNFHLEKRYPDFANKSEVTSTGRTSILQEINIREAKTPAEAMWIYQRLIELEAGLRLLWLGQARHGKPWPGRG